MIPVETNEKEGKKESSSNGIGSSFYDQESIYRQFKEATAFLDCERIMVQSNRLSEKVNQLVISDNTRLLSSIVYGNYI
jgi:uncharacterized protein YacL (UPF0231 family)